MTSFIHPKAEWENNDQLCTKSTSGYDNFDHNFHNTLNIPKQEAGLTYALSRNNRLCTLG
ncbi:hypothetical protein MTR_8g100035 [Medicago truncatula]|uniref:Uncharacterized protein n=1 Tax=Medicago truncatula TaxID=3880 RepID=A0A072TWN5_MEDTR|nr:hypothetical protein MTR_8g100035 [Medicago truncatula]